MRTGGEVCLPIGNCKGAESVVANMCRFEPGFLGVGEALLGNKAAVPNEPLDAKEDRGSGNGGGGGGVSSGLLAAVNEGEQAIELDPGAVDVGFVHRSPGKHGEEPVDVPELCLVCVEAMFTLWKG